MYGSDYLFPVLLAIKSGGGGGQPTFNYGASLSMTIDSSTFVVTAQLLDQNGNALGQAQTIDLPLESVVVGGSYNDTTKKVVLTLQNGNTIEFSVADLVAGLQSEITSTNKLDADLVDDSTSTNKFVSSTEKTAWNGKQSAITNSNKLSSDLVDDTNNTHKFATAAQLAQIATNASDILTKIGASDYATQNTGGTVRVWTTTDGSDITLHISNEAPTP